MDQELEDSFLMITSTKTDLDSTSFLSSLDMDPQLTGYAFGGGGGGGGGGLVSPAASRMVSPLGSGTATEGYFHSLSTSSTQGSSGAVTGTSTPDGSGSGRGSAMGETKREVFSDFRRFVSFGLRKDTT